MTREQKDNWARVCAELTDNLPSKINTLGASLIKAMARANRPGCQLDGDMAVGRVNGILETLSIMGIPHKVIRKGKYGDYLAVEIAGEMFYVTGSADADADNGGQEGE